MENTEQGAAAEPPVRGRGLVVRRGGRLVLDRLSFSLARGEVTGLLGPSGCGKTTLMRVLAGVQVVTAGTVTVLGLPAGHPRLRARLGYATQEPAVYTDLTLAENLRYFGTVLGLRGRPLADAVATAMGRLDLGGLDQRLVGTFSGGQLARAGLAVALLGRPSLLLLDEPTVGLDPVLRQDLWSLFHRLAAEGTSLLVSSHVMDEAARCDRLLFMREGRFLAQAPPAEILRQTGAPDLEAAFLTLALPAPRAVGR
jgi:ABC-2 type transport system ATP-binding protein